MKDNFSGHADQYAIGLLSHLVGRKTLWKSPGRQPISAHPRTVGAHLGAGSASGSLRTPVARRALL